MVLWKKLFLLSILTLSFGGCLGLPENSSSDELSPETAEDVAPDAEGAVDEFADFEDSAAPTESAATAPAETVTTVDNDEFADPVETAQPAEMAPAPAETAATAGDEFSEFEQQPTDVPLAQPEVAQNTPSAAPADEFDLDNELLPPVAEPPVEQPVATTKVDELDPFIMPEPPIAQPATIQTAANVRIKSIQYKANDTGGAILIQADGPINFITRNNPDTQQLIVEIPGAVLPDRLKRPFNMRDIKGAFGSMDPYQEKGSNVARFVVQVRPNSSDPFVTVEGDTLLIVADKSQVSSLTNTSVGAAKTVEGNLQNPSASSDRVLTSRTLQEFLTDNSKFYGKRISIETNSMAVRDALRFISEEGGVNMIIADNVTGNVSLKLRDIPWDQAFVIIMKSKDLGYIRQGNVLRIATLADLRREEDATIKLATDRIRIEPLVVKVFPINYAKVEDLATRIKEFLTDRGKVVGDGRTNAIVVTDIQQSLDRVEQLIQNLDTQPPQVLIEGRIIEATDSFQRQIGINWGFSGNAYKVGTSKDGDVNIRPSLQINNGNALSNNLGFTMGTLDIFGQLSANLTLAEVENKIRILSSPRIVTLSNEKATINQTIKRPYKSITTTAQTTTETITFQNLELVLDVTPQITSDASVIMSIKVKRDLVGEAVTVGGERAIESREANTKVMVKNGQTSVIGGVYQNDSNDSVAGVPWLKDIPVLGSLFKFKDTSNRRTELMIFLTPRIVAAGSDSAVIK